MSSKVEIGHLYALLHKAVTLENSAGSKVDSEYIKNLFTEMGLEFIFEDQGFKDTYDMFLRFKPTTYFRNFRLIEAILSAKPIQKIFFNYANGGIRDGYILFVKKSSNEYTQLHHFHRLDTFLFPAHDPNVYIHFLRLIAQRKLRNTQAKPTIDFLVPKAGNDLDESEPFLRAITNLTKGHGDGSDLLRLMENAQNSQISLNAALKSLRLKICTSKQKVEYNAFERLLAREIIDEYIAQQRSDLLKSYKAEDNDKGIENIPFARQLSSNLAERSHFEKLNNIFLAPEGELLFGVILQRWAELCYKINKDGGYEIKDQSDYGISLLSEDKIFQDKDSLIKWAEWSIDKNLNILIKRNDNQYFLTNSFLRVLHTIYAAKNDTQHPVYIQLGNLFIKSAATAGEEHLHLFFQCVEQLLNEGKAPVSLEKVLEFFTLLFSENKHLPFNDYQLSQKLHFDAFVMQVFMSRYEEQLNLKDSNIHRYFYAFPIDPIIAATNGKDQGGTDQDVFALWIGFLEQPEEFKNQDINPKIIRLKNMLSLLGQPIVRERIEHDLNEGTQRARESARTAARAAIMARNMSHNIGSHVLSALDYEDFSSEELAKFYSYMQERMDFIAGVTSGWVGVPEEMYFFKDIMDNFLKNIPLLRLIVASHRYSTKTISFIINNAYKASYRFTADKNIWEYQWFKMDGTNVNPEIVIPDDFLVAIPRGMVGRHAFYTILENVIRNSAKYGKDKQNTMSVYINIVSMDKKVVYKLQIYDNCSPRTFIDNKNIEHDLSKEINYILDQEIIKQDNTPNYDNMGIIEIKIASELLVPSSLDNPRLRQQIKREFSIRTDEDSDRLTYCTFLQKPKLMQIVTEIPDAEVKELPVGFNVTNHYDSTLEPNYFYNLTIFDERYKDNLQNDKNRLPYRYICTQASRGGFSPQTIWWQEEYLRQYGNWLRFKYSLPDSPKYKLILSFTRDPEVDRWCSLLKAETRKGNNNYIDLVKNVFDLHIFHTPGDFNAGQKFPLIENDDEENPLFMDQETGNLLVYDNHNEFYQYCKYDDLIPKLHFMHPMGNTHRYLKMYMTLAHPPENNFSRSLLLMALFEASLARILILDERIAEGFYSRVLCQNGHDMLKEECEQYDRFLGTIIPMFIELPEIKEGEKIFFSEKVKESYNQIKEIENQARQDDSSYKIDIWGIRITEKGFTLVSDDFTCCREFSPHFFVIHQGIVDEHIHPRIKDKSFYKGLCQTIQGIQTHLVVTSGRGRFIKHLRNDLPFIEFSTLKGYFLDSFSKVDLVKALSSCKGGITARS